MWSALCICYSYCFPFDHFTRTSADRWSAVVRGLAAMRDLVCGRERALPLQKPTGCHGREPFAQVSSVLLALTILCLRLDKSTKGLIEGIFTKASPSFDGSQDLFLSMKITVGSLAGRRQWGWGVGREIRIPKGVLMTSSSGSHSKRPAPLSRV